MPRHAFARFSKRTSPYSRPVRRIGSYRPRVTRRRSLDEEAVTSGVALARTAIPRSLLPSGSRGSSTNVHAFARWRDTRGGTHPGALHLSCNFPASGWTALGLNFDFANISHSAELQALYDSYRIDKIELWFDYSPDTAPGGVVSTAFFPKLWIKRDYNDSNTPTLDEMEQSNQTQVLRFAADTTTLGPYFLKPAAQVGVVDAAAALQPTMSSWAPWLRTAHPTIEHYGVKMVAQGLPSSNMGAISVRVRFHVTMKNVR